MANYPAGERYVTAPANRTVPVPLAPVKASGNKDLVPATHPCKYTPGPTPSAGERPSPRKV